MSTSPRPGTAKPGAGIAKRHAACDECRTRKLKCSGSHPKCSRCEREGLRCEYSLQKRMGRPKKLSQDDNARRSPSYIDRQISLGSSPPTPLLRQESLSDGYASVDDLGFGNFMVYKPAQQSQTSVGHDVGLQATSGVTVSAADSLYGSQNMATSWHSATTAMDGASMFATTSSYQDSSISAHYAQTSLPTPPDMTTPPLTSNYDYTQHVMDTMYSPNPTCACLSTMYLTLSSLSTLETYDFPQILAPLRSALAVASSVMDCQHCPQNAAASMQNLGVLNTLLWSILERICQALRAIDHEALRLEQNDQTKLFRIGDSSPESAHLHDGTADCSAAWSVELRATEWKQLAKKAIQAEAGRTAGRPVATTLSGLVERLIARQLQWHSDPEMIANRAWCQGNTAQHGAHPMLRHGHNGERCEHDCARQARTLQEILDKIEFE